MEITGLGSTAPIPSVSISPCAGYFAVLAADGALKIWSTTDSQLVTSRPGDLGNPATCSAWDSGDHRDQVPLSNSTLESQSQNHSQIPRMQQAEDSYIRCFRL